MVDVELAFWVLVHGFEFALDVGAGFVKVVAPGVFGEAELERGAADFLLENVFFIEEEDDGGATEEVVIADGAEEAEGFLHAVLWGLGIGIRRFRRCFHSPPTRPRLKTDHTRSARRQTILM